MQQSFYADFFLYSKESVLEYQENHNKMIVEIRLKVTSIIVDSRLYFLSLMKC